MKKKIIPLFFLCIRINDFIDVKITANQSTMDGMYVAIAI